MTIIYNVAAGAGDSTAGLGSATSDRYGIQLNGATGVLVGKPISTFAVSLRKSGAPVGNITAVVRNSADSVVATFQETISASSLPTSFALQTFTLASPYTMANGDRILVEYSGTATVTIELYTTDQFDGLLTRRTRRSAGVYSESSTADIAATVDDGLTPSSTSFSPISFTSTSFTGGGTVVVVPVVIPPQGGGKGRKPSKYRNYILSLARSLKDLFRIKQRPKEEPEEVEIPEPQPPKTVTILSSPPTMETAAKLETINDKWSIVASVPPPETRTEIIYPLIINPVQQPLIQKKVTLPQPTFQEYIPAPILGEGSHIESRAVGLTKPKNRSKTASTINTLMILLEIERQI